MKYLIITFQFLVLNLYSQIEKEHFNTFLKNEQLQTANVSFQVYNISINKDVIKYNQNKLMVPASVVKLITTSTALNVLGKDFQFTTVVKFNGEIKENIFKGVIEVEASGDPTLNRTFVDGLYNFIKSKNISKIEGYIKVNQTIYDNTTPQTWLIEDVANYYGSPAFSFNYLKNTYLLTFSKNVEEKTPKILSTNPNMKKFIFENKLISGPKNSGDNAYILGLPFSNKRQVVGTIPSGIGTFSIKGAINNPAQIFKNELIEKFKKEKFNFVFNSKVVPSKIIFTFNHKSESLSSIIKTTNQKSINLYAESLLKMIGYKKYNKGTTENGIKVIENKYQNDHFKLYDGSGLSRKDLLSTQFVTSILLNNHTNTIFKNSLGVSGKSGTMKYFNSEKIKGKVFAKSGSADGILNYAGYFKNNKGENFTFVIFINNYTGDRKELRKKIILLMEKYSS